MLVIARREGEIISIADGLIRIKVLSVQGKIARIGIAAPREISARREEVETYDAALSSSDASSIGGASAHGAEPPDAGRA